MWLCNKCGESLPGSKEDRNDVCCPDCDQGPFCEKHLLSHDCDVDVDEHGTWYEEKVSMSKGE